MNCYAAQELLMVFNANPWAQGCAFKQAFRGTSPFTEMGVTDRHGGGTAENTDMGTILMSACDKFFMIANNQTAMGLE